MKYDDYKDCIDHLVEIRGVYDGWSVALLSDGSMVNRWANEDGSGPELRYANRWAATQKWIEEAQSGK